VTRPDPGPALLPTWCIQGTYDDISWREMRLLIITSEKWRRKHHLNGEITVDKDMIRFRHLCTCQVSIYHW
jgi:hypothetical protein